jgi:hypothetical protein
MPTPASNRPSEASPEQEALTQEDINERLRLKRKSRGQKACYPCRQRKVGCNYARPCQKCVDRDHPELCIYEPVSKRPNLGIAETSNVAIREAPGKDRELLLDDDNIGDRLSSIERSLTALRTDLANLTAIIATGARPPPVRVPRDTDSDDPEAEDRGIHTSNAMTGETVHIGGNSVPAMVLALGDSGDNKENNIQGLLGKSILPIFGLDNESATYPFVDLWGLPHGSHARLQGLCKLLPSNADCLQYFKQYRDTAHILFPAVVDINTFESELTHFLIRRGDVHTGSRSDNLTVRDVYGKSLHWVGLMFATLASGYQSSSVPRKERQLTCQVYICCAYECLRIVNYLSNATLLDIQTMLVLGNVISNNMNAGVAWCFLGLTIRLAQSLGLHQIHAKSLTDTESVMREEIWSRVVWQDSLLSITYDRASPTTATLHRKTPRELNAVRLSYSECMKILSSTGLEIVRERTRHEDHRIELARIESHRQDIEEMMEHSVRHLQDPAFCMSIKDQLEYWNLYMHRSYVLSELYRSSLRRKVATPEVSGFRSTCIENLANTVDAWLGLQNVTRFATQSWAAIHRSLSSALLLGILKQPQENARIHTLLDKLIDVMNSVNSSNDPTEVSAPISRAVMALSRLNSPSAGTMPPPKPMTPIPTSAWEQRLNADLIMYDESPIERKSSSEGSPYEVMEKILWNPM